jgi:hypothetical protein
LELGLITQPWHKWGLEMPKIQESKEIGRKSKSPRRKFYKDHVDR